MFKVNVIFFLYYKLSLTPSDTVLHTYAESKFIF